MNADLDNLTINTAEDKDLAEFFSRKEPGDTFKFTGTATMKENNDGVVVASVEEIEPEDAEEDAAEGEEETPTPPKGTPKRKGKMMSAAEQMMQAEGGMGEMD